MQFINYADDADIIFQNDDGSGGVTAYLTLDGSHTETVFSESARFADSKEARFGTSSDFKIYHNGSNSYLEQSGTGNLYIMNTTNDKDIIFLSDDGSGGVTTYFYLNGSGAAGSGDTGLKSTVFPDGSLASFGNDSDLSLYHYSGNSAISNNTGNLTISNLANDKDIIFQTDDGSGGVTAYLTLDGSAGTVEIAKSTNISGTVTVTGSITAGAHDGSDKLYVNRFNGTYPYGHIQAGSADENVKVGIKLDTRKADGVAENALVIEGDTRAATFTGAVTSTGTLTTGGTIELGHASDTTLARSAAGVVTIESKPIQTTNVHHHFIHAGFVLGFPYARYIPLNGSLSEQNTATGSPEYVNFTCPYDGFVKTMWLRSETDMGSTNLKLYKGAAGATVTTELGNVTATVGATATVEFDFTSVTNTFDQGDTIAILCDPTEDPDGGQNITIELVFDLTT